MVKILIRTIQKDAKRYGIKTLYRGGCKFVVQKTFRQIVLFRIGTFMKSTNKSNGLYAVPYFIIKVLYRSLCYSTGIQLEFGTKIGAGIFFAHYSCIVINRECVIGENCTIYQGVTFRYYITSQWISPKYR